jgi:hypothetical protein
MKQLIEFFKTILSKTKEFKHGSTAIEDQKAIEEFASNPDNTFLISFPRTGSHWLRMIMELYFERPSLVRIFYFPENNNYLTLHTHDLELNVEHPRVIYLYRDPVDTIYSQLNYHQEYTGNQQRISHWSDLYGRHLDKWLHKEKFSQQKTIITYEGMKKDLINEFRKVTDHFSHSLDVELLSQISKQISKKEVKNKNLHDKNVIKLKLSYNTIRAEFRKQYGNLIWQVLTKKREHLFNYFEKAKMS